MATKKVTKNNTRTSKKTTAKNSTTVKTKKSLGFYEWLHKLGIG